MEHRGRFISGPSTRGTFVLLQPFSYQKNPHKSKYSITSWEVHSLDMPKGISPGHMYVCALLLVDSPSLPDGMEGEKTEVDVLYRDGLQPRCQLTLRLCSSSQNLHRELVSVVTAWLKHPKKDKPHLIKQKLSY